MSDVYSSSSSPSSSSYEEKRFVLYVVGHVVDGDEIFGVKLSLFNEGTVNASLYDTNDRNTASVLGNNFIIAIITQPREVELMKDPRSLNFPPKISSDHSKTSTTYASLLNILRDKDVIVSKHKPMITLHVIY